VGVPATGCSARGEGLVGVTRKANKPALSRSSHLRAGSTRDENPREPVPLATGGPTTDLLLAKGRVQELALLTKASGAGVDLETAARW